MSTSSLSTYSFGDPSDLAKQLGEDGVSYLLEIVCDAYRSLYQKHIVKQEMSEDDITEELFVEIVFTWSRSSITKSIRPVCQKGDKTLAKPRGKPPTIDFCFRNSWVGEAFFGFECKILVEGDKGLCNEYVENGLCRYLSGAYCAHGSAGSLIGYVKLGNISIIIHDVKARVDTQKMLAAMVLAAPIGRFKEHYVSVHEREMPLPPFRVHHLFFSFA
jgi:hypothetical protein